MKKSFEFSFDDESAKATGRRSDQITIEHSGRVETLKVRAADGSVSIYANKEALLTLGKVLLKMGLGDYRNGFHLHLGEDFGFDPLNTDPLTIVIVE